MVEVRGGRYFATLYVGGLELPVQQIKCTYQINSIPTAEVTVAAGRELVYRLGNPSNIYYFQPTVDAMIPAAITINNKIVFCGYVGSVGFAQSTASDNAQVVASLSLVHWLNLLNFATLFGPHTHAGSPARFVLDPIMLGNNGDIAGAVSMLGTLVTNVHKNVWENMKPLLREICKKAAVFDTRGAGKQLNINLVDSDKPSKRKSSDILDLIRSPLPLSLEAYPEILPFLPERIVQDLIGSYLHPNGPSTTLWERIERYIIPAFLLTLIPLPMSALVVPYTPTTTPYGSITANDQSFIQASATMVAPISAIGLYPPSHQSAQFLDGNVANNLLGAFVSGRPGRIMFLGAPSHLGMSSSAIIDSLRNISGVWPSTIRGYKQWASAVKEVIKQINERYSDAKLANAYAAAYYDQLLFSQREAIVITPLDIVYAPGTSIYVQSAVGAWPWLAYVHGVRIMLDAESAAATAQYVLKYCRSQIEQDSFGFPYSPVYKVAWTGGVLF